MADLERREAKVAFLSVVNGMGRPAFVERWGERAAAGLFAFCQGFEAFMSWLGETVPDVWETPLGRTVDTTGRPPHTRRGILLQSYEADALRWVLMNYTGNPVHTAHDEVLAEEPIAEAALRLGELEEVMEEALARVAGLGKGGAKGSAKVDLRRTWGGGK